MDATGGNWFMYVAMDGVVGGLIGGLATGLAVWWTLRHEGRRGRLGEAQAIAAPLQAMALTFGMNMSAPSVTRRDQLWDQYIEMQGAVLELYARTVRDWPRFAEDIREAGSSIRKVFSSAQPGQPVSDAQLNQVVVAAGTTASLAGSWLAAPWGSLPSRTKRLWRRIRRTKR
jgi:hypothetical protein